MHVSMEGGAEGDRQQFHTLDVQSLQPPSVGGNVRTGEIRRTTFSGLSPSAGDQPPEANPPAAAAVLPRPKPVPPSYEEAVSTGRVIRESYASTVYSPGYGAPIYPCDHNPSQVCYNCIESLPRGRQDGRVWRVRACHALPLKPRHPIWLKVAFFLITFAFFLVVFAIMYNLLVVEAIFWYGDQIPSTTIKPPYAK